MVRLAAMVAVVLWVAPVFAQTVASLPGSQLPVQPDFRFDTVLDDRGNIRQVLVRRGNEQVQALASCTGQDVSRGKGVGQLAREDFNFDGYLDLAMSAASDREGNLTECVWLFDPASQRFVLSSKLSQMPNPVPDADTRTIISHRREDCAGSCYDETIYSWRNGKLVPVREEWESEDPTVFPGSDCRFVRGAKKEKNGKLVETSRMRVDVGGVMCEPHPFD